MTVRKRFVYSVVALCLSQVLHAAMPRPCDFNGPDPDGRQRDDYAVYNPDTGLWYIKSPLGDVLATHQQWGWHEADPVPGDYDGDGRGDLAIFDRLRGDWFVASLATQSQIVWQVNWGWDGTVPVPGDYDGDSRTDFAVYHRATGRWYIKAATGAVLINGDTWGWEYAWPVPGDYDGDGRDDMAIYHRPSGTWYIRSVAGGLLANGVNWGWKEAWPVAGDFDGDGASDLAIYHRAAGEWYIRTLDGRGLIYGDVWGWPEASPVGMDVDGDGATDMGIYHRKSGTWYVRSTAGAQLVYGENWGWQDTIPGQTYACPASEAVTFLAFGDSITWGEGSTTDMPETGYPRLLERQLREHFGGWFYMINAGVPGEATWQGEKRIAAVLDQHKPDAMLYMEGTNDALYDFMFQGTERFMRLVLNEAVARSVPTVMATIPPVITTDTVNRTNQMARIVAFNPNIFRIAGDYGFRVANVFNAITSVPNWEEDLMHQPSANHPNDAGYLRVRDAFYNEVSAALLNGELY